MLDDVSCISLWWLHCEGSSRVALLSDLLESKELNRLDIFPTGDMGDKSWSCSERVRLVRLSFCIDFLQLTIIRSSSTRSADDIGISSLLISSSPIGVVSTSTIPCSPRPSNARLRHLLRWRSILRTATPST